MPKLTVIDGLDMGKSVPVGDRPVTIGHHPSRDFVLSDDRVSRMHVTVLRRGQEIVVRDENSTNGTFLNGKPIREAALRSGDCLLLGDTVLLYEDEREPLPAGRRGEKVVLAPSDAGAAVSATDATVALGGPAQTRIAAPRHVAGGADATVLARPSEHHPQPVPPPAAEAGGAIRRTDVPPVDLVPVVREAVEAARPLASGRGVELRLSAPASARSPVVANAAYRLVAQTLECCLAPLPAGTLLHLDLALGPNAVAVLSATAAEPGRIRKALRDAGVGPLGAALAEARAMGVQWELPAPDAPGDTLFDLGFPAP